MARNPKRVRMKNPRNTNERGRKIKPNGTARGLREAEADELQANLCFWTGLNLFWVSLFVD